MLYTNCEEEDNLPWGKLINTTHQDDDAMRDISQVSAKYHVYTTLTIIYTGTHSAIIMSPHTLRDLCVTIFHKIIRKQKILKKLFAYSKINRTKAYFPLDEKFARSGLFFRRDIRAKKSLFSTQYPSAVKADLYPSIRCCCCCGKI